MADSFARYIVVEGVIGVGKTTLVKALAERLTARTVFEVFDENPFLASFYDDPKRFAFSTEMFFLLSRYNQQELFSQGDLLQQYAVSDYLFDKCRLFARETLNEAELRLFDRMYEILVRDVPVPDLVLHLHAPLDTVLARIRERARGYEQDIDPNYLERLDTAYRGFFARYDAAPVWSIDTTDIDFRDPAQVDTLIDALASKDRPAFAEPPRPAPAPLADPLPESSS